MLEDWKQMSMTEKKSYPISFFVERTCEQAEVEAELRN